MHTNKANSVHAPPISITSLVYFQPPKSHTTTDIKDLEEIPGRQVAPILYHRKCPLHYVGCRIHLRLESKGLINAVVCATIRRPNVRRIFYCCPPDFAIGLRAIRPNLIAPSVSLSTVVQRRPGSKARLATVMLVLVTNL